VDGSPLISAVELTAMTSSGAVRAVDRTDEIAPGTRVGEYEIVQKIGEGGMGMVYGALHPLIGKRAAIKVIHRNLSANTEASDRFIREAQAVNQIGHPNIVDVFGFGELPDGRRFFVMEWLKGESLGARLERELPTAEALEILEAVTKALEAAHDAGVLHRDLKPDNVFLQERKGEKPVVKLLDFGLAKLSGTVDETLDTTRTGAVMGTPLYISPEQAKGEKVDFATDVYSLGAIAYQLFSGDVPFRATSAVETMALHISQPVVPLASLVPTLPAEIDQLVRAMLDKDPRKRPSVARVREQLAALRLPDVLVARDSRPLALANAMARSDLALAATTATGPTPKTRRSPAPIILGVVGFAAAAIVAALVVGRGSSRPAAAPAVATAPPAIEPMVPPAPSPPPPPTPSSEALAPAVEPPPPPPPVKPEKHAARPKVGTVVITIAGATQARIIVDDEVVAQGVRTVTRSLSPGPHTIRARSKDHRPAVGTVQVVAGRTQTLRLTLEKKPRSLNAVKDPFEDE
jgi:serine/threonine-protein kinase